MAGVYAGVSPAAFAAHPSTAALGALLSAAIDALGQGDTVQAQNARLQAMLRDAAGTRLRHDELEAEVAQLREALASQADAKPALELEQLAAEQGVTPFDPDTFRPFDPPLTDQERGEMNDALNELDPETPVAAYRRGREEAAQAIADHRDKHWPLNDDLNPAQRTLRRHLNIAIQVAALDPNGRRRRGSSPHRPLHRLRHRGAPRGLTTRSA
jgi:hypothetical protein